MVDGAQPEFWEEAQALIAGAPIAFLATAWGEQPIARAVTPTYEGLMAYVATDPDTSKVRQVRRNPLVDLLHWSTDFRHLSLRGRASMVDDAVVRERMWSAFPYALEDYFEHAGCEGQKAAYGLMRIEPFRIELWSLGSLATGKPPQVWRAR